MYTDAFVLPVPTKNLAAYRAMSRKCMKIWLEHGALEYRECAADDLAPKGMRPFTAGAAAKTGETVVFSWILYKSKAHRNAVNKKVMADPRLNALCGKGPMPFDVKRMMYGGFKIIVSS